MLPSHVALCANDLVSKTRSRKVIQSTLTVRTDNRSNEFPSSERSRPLMIIHMQLSPVLASSALLLTCIYVAAS